VFIYFKKWLEDAGEVGDFSNVEKNEKNLTDVGSKWMAGKTKSLPSKFNPNKLFGINTTKKIDK
jgi:hypothetical protein